MAAVLGGGLIVAGSFLNWSGVTYSSHTDRGLALAAGLLSMLAAALGLAWRPRILVLAVPFGVLALNMGLVNYDDIANRLYEYRAYPQASVGVGLYLVIVGAVLAIVAGVTALAPRRWLSPARRG